MRSTISVLIFVILVILTAGLPAYAQKETGGIQGVVTDIDGLPLEGVTVTTESTTLSRGKTVTYTDRDGHYRFPVLGPGVYDVTAELQGFQTSVRKDVRVSVGTTATVNLGIGQTLEESLEVSGDTPLIDATTTASSKTVGIESIENLPKFAFALDLFTLTPGIGDISYVAYGAGGSQANAYWMDGVDLSNPVGGSYWIFPNYNWIEEVQVIGIGAPAEYGGFTGVITNSVTRSGSNEYHGLFETFFENQSLVSNNIDNPELEPDRTDLFTDSTAQLSGRLVRDKLWFFASGQYYYTRYAPFGYPPIGSETFVKDEQPRILGKLTYKLNQNNNLQGFAQWDNYQRDGQGADALTLEEATGIANGPEWLWNAAWVSLFNPETVLDVRYSGYRSTYDILPKNGQIPGHSNINSDISSVNYYRNYLTDRDRNQVNASLSHYARDFIKGSHDFKFGIEYERSAANRDYTWTGNAYYYDGDIGDNPYDPTSPYLYRTLWEGYTTEGRVRRTSLYVQDDWHITDKVDISVGVRYDHNHAFLADNPQFEYTTTPLAPRLGFVYDVKGNQQTVIKGHYGQYYDKAITFYIDGIDDFGAKTFQYWYGTYWGTYRESPGVGNFTIDPDLKQTYVNQYTIGVDQALPAGVTLSAHYIHRDFKNFIEDVGIGGVYEEVPFVNPITGQTMTLFNELVAPTTLFITNPDGLFRKYDAIEVYGGKRFSKKLTLNGSVVWSRTRGNTSNTDGGADGFTNLFDDPNYLINADGIPIYDPTWEFKVTGFYEFPWEILSSFYYRHFTGDTWTPVIRIPNENNGGINQGAILIFGVPRGSERLPSRNVVDFRLEKAFPIYTGNLKFTMDVYNLFNSGYIYDVETEFDTDFFSLPIDFTAPREIRLGVRYQF